MASGNAYLIEDVVSASKRSEFFPISQNTFTDPDDLIAFGNEELQLKIVPLIMSVRESYFSTNKVVSFRELVDAYPIPERAIGNAFTEIWYLPDTSDTSKKYLLRKRNKGDVGYSAVSSNVPAGYYIEGDEVVMVPKPRNVTTQGIMFDYYARPNKLVQTTACAKITGSATVSGTTTFTVNTDLTASLSVGSKIDFLSATSPFLLWASDQIITAITSTTIAVAASGVTDGSGALEPQTNDYICAAQTANIPMIPLEFHPIVPELICYRALKALGAQAKMAACAQNIKDMMQGALKLMSNRVDADVDVVYDSTGFLASIGGFGSGWIVPR